MATNLSRETAKIFVLRPNAAASTHRPLDAKAVEAELRARRAAAAALGSAWYHEAALDEADDDTRQH